MTSEVAISNNVTGLIASYFSNAEMVQTIKQTVAKGTNDTEFAMFGEICKSTGLNPFKKEIWCIITGSGQWRQCQIMIGINGLYEIANNDPMFDGIEYNYGPEIQVDVEGKNTVKSYEWIESHVFRKDRGRPQIARVFWSEYAKDTLSKSGRRTIWGEKPIVMLTKCADSVALRKAFSQKLNGTYSDAEMPEKFSLKVENISEKSPKEQIEERMVNEGLENDIVEAEFTSQEERRDYVQEAKEINCPDKLRDWFKSNNDQLSVAERSEIVAHGKRLRGEQTVA